MSRADEWRTRLTHESKLHTSSSFLTLTYSDTNLPDDLSVSLRPLQLFLKRLRKQLAPKSIRFFACGEYGDRTHRPHYHALIFGHDFSEDRKPWRKAPSGHTLYRSEVLERCWTLGSSELGIFTPDSAGYVARYCLKKINGDRAATHYQRVHPETGEIVTVRPEFATMSTRPGIGAEWFTRFQADAFPSDFVVVEGIKKPIPRYYHKKLTEQDERAATMVKLKRQQRALPHKENNTPDRLATRQYCLSERMKHLKRDLD